MQISRKKYFIFGLLSPVIFWWIIIPLIPLDLIWKKARDVSALDFDVVAEIVLMIILLVVLLVLDKKKLLKDKVKDSLFFFLGIASSIGLVILYFIISLSGGSSFCCM
jgi:hypothetical protein